MKFRNVFLISGMSTLITILLFFLAPILPCRVIPIPINSESFWSLCSLNSLKSIEFQTENIFLLGIFQNIILFTLVVGTILFILFSILISKLFYSKK